MRLRFGILVLVLVAGLSGCGGSDSKPASSKTDSSTAPTSSAPTDSADPGAGTVPCAKFLSSQAKASELYSKLASHSGDPASIEDAVSAIKAEFDALKVGAPSNVVGALSDLESVYDLYAKAMKDPASIQTNDYAALGTRLQTDATTVGTYVSKNCAS